MNETKTAEKQNTETQAAPETSSVPATTNGAPLQTQGSTSVELFSSERPAFIPEGDTTGTEGIGVDDIRLPRLVIAQGLSPEMTPGDSKYIQGLTMFDLFNDFTKEVYGKGPLTFVVIRRDVRRIEFKPRSEGGGVKDMNVPANDPRTLWTADPDDPAKRIAPKATKFNEYVIWLLKPGVPEPETILLSIKDTNKFNRRATTDLNGFIKQHASKGKKSVPIYGVAYTIASAPEKNDQGTFGTPVIKQAGKDGKPAFITNQDFFAAAAKFEQSLRGKNIVVDREPGDDDVDFEPVPGPGAEERM